MAKNKKTKQTPDLAGERTIKRFRVCREGQTVDGRSISQHEIIDIAETYDPVEYTARINCEHISGWFDGLDGKFSALGDVIAVDCQLEKFNRNGQEVELMCLYATLSALPNLVQANKKGKKLFTSIEFYRKFADTGRAYLVGLAVTDNPASLGTEPLRFNTQSTNSLFSQPQELILMKTQANQLTTQASTEEQTPKIDQTSNINQLDAEDLTRSTVTDNDKEDGFLIKLKTMFSKGEGKGKGMSKEEQDQVLESFGIVQNQLDKLHKSYTEMSNAHKQLHADFKKLSDQLSEQEDFTNVGEVTGEGEELADF